MNYNILIKNEANCIIYTRTIFAKSENDALLKAINEDRVLLASGDTIEIEEF